MLSTSEERINGNSVQALNHSKGNEKLRHKVEIPREQKEMGRKEGLVRGRKTLTLNWNGVNLSHLNKKTIKVEEGKRTHSHHPQTSHRCHKSNIPPILSLGSELSIYKKSSINPPSSNCNKENPCSKFVEINMGGEIVYPGRVRRYLQDEYKQGMSISLGSYIGRRGEIHIEGEESREGGQGGHKKNVLPNTLSRGRGNMNMSNNQGEGKIPNIRHIKVHSQLLTKAPTTTRNMSVRTQERMKLPLNAYENELEESKGVKRMGNRKMRRGQSTGRKTEQHSNGSPISKFTLKEVLDISNCIYQIQRQGQGTTTASTIPQSTVFKGGGAPETDRDTDRERAIESRKKRRAVGTMGTMGSVPNPHDLERRSSWEYPEQAAENRNIEESYVSHKVLDASYGDLERSTSFQRQESKIMRKVQEIIRMERKSKNSSAHASPLLTDGIRAQGGNGGTHHIGTLHNAQGNRNPRNPRNPRSTRLFRLPQIYLSNIDGGDTKYTTFYTNNNNRKGSSIRMSGTASHTSHPKYRSTEIRDTSEELNTLNRENKIHSPSVEEVNVNNKDGKGYLSYILNKENNNESGRGPHLSQQEMHWIKSIQKEGDSLQDITFPNGLKTITNASHNPSNTKPPVPNLHTLQTTKPLDSSLIFTKNLRRNNNILLDGREIHIPGRIRKVYRMGDHPTKNAFPKSAINHALLKQSPITSKSLERRNIAPNLLGVNNININNIKDERERKSLEMQAFLRQRYYGVGNFVGDLQGITVIAGHKTERVRKSREKGRGSNPSIPNHSGGLSARSLNKGSPINSPTSNGTATRKTVFQKKKLTRILNSDLRADLDTEVIIDVEGRQLFADTGLHQNNSKHSFDKEEEDNTQISISLDPQ